MTVISADPEDASTFAMIVASPLPTAVTRPEASTAATELSLDVQVMVTPAITPPFWLRTSAVS